jgi:ribonuclease Z
MHILKREKPLAIYVHKNLNEALYSLLNNCLIFPEKLNFNFNVNLFDSDEDVAVSELLHFTSKQNRHVTNKHKINYLPAHNFISSSFKIQSDDCKIIYTSDVGSPEDLYLFSETDIDLLITETTHVHTEDILEAINKLAPTRTYLTHIDEIDESALADFTSSNDSSKIVLACDGLEITL